jgi:purine-binding chemotaxis protein CheW
MTLGRSDELSALSSDARQLLVRRADRIGAPEMESEAEEDSMWVASFVIGDEQFAIPLSALRAAVPRQMVTRVPRSSRLVVGVLQFQGQVIAALSLAALLESQWRDDPDILLVVDAGDGHTVALDCAHVPLATVLPLPLFRQAAAHALGPFTRVTVAAGCETTVIDLRRLLESHNWGGDSGSS